MKKSSDIAFWDLTCRDEESVVEPYRVQQAQDEVASITWTPRGADTKEKYVVYTKSGMVEQKSFTEESKFICDLSARGHIVMSSASRTTLHSLPFFDSVFNYEALRHQFLEDSKDANSPYSEEGLAFGDI